MTKKQSMKKLEQWEVNAHLFVFDYENLMHHEYAPKRQIINEEYYLQVMKRLLDAVGRKGPQF